MIAVRVNCVSTLVAFTVTPGTTALVESVMVPSSVAVAPVWAKRDPEHAASSAGNVFHFVMKSPCELVGSMIDVSGMEIQSRVSGDV